MCKRSVAIIYKKVKVDIFNNKQVMELFRNSGTPLICIAQISKFRVRNSTLDKICSRLHDPAGLTGSQFIKLYFCST
jgi:hypothetical protein